MNIAFRPATEDDLPAIVRLLADDPLGAARETGTPADYQAAFARITACDAVQLFVGEADGRVVATYQLVIVPGLSSAGRIHAILEAVRVEAPLRSQGLGAQLVQDAERRARAGGAGVLQLITHKSRARAHAFYERLGFTPSHIGYKRDLT